MDPLLPNVVSGVFKSLLTRGVFAQVGGALEARRARKVERAFQLLIDSLVDVGSLPADQAEARIEHLLTNVEEGLPDPHETLYAAFRSFAFTRTEAAWPLIARMTAEYLQSGTGIDDYFRRTGWLLERCEDEDIALLKAGLGASHGLLRAVRADRREGVGIEWSSEGHHGLKLSVNPDTAEDEPAFVGGFSSSRCTEAVALLGESRVGVARGGSVHFPVRDGRLTRLIGLFCLLS